MSYQKCDVSDATITEGLSALVSSLTKLDKAEEHLIDIQRKTQDELLAIQNRRREIMGAIQKLSQAANPAVPCYAPPFEVNLLYLHHPTN